MDVNGHNMGIIGGTDNKWYARPLERVEYEGPGRLKRRPYLFSL